MTISDYIPAILRTATPYLIGLLGSLLSTNGVEIPSELVAGLTAALTFILGTVYYLFALVLQKAYPNNFIVKYLLGSPKSPTYKE